MNEEWITSFVWLYVFELICSTCQMFVYDKNVDETGFHERMFQVWKCVLTCVCVLYMDILKVLYLYGRACPMFASCNVSRANRIMLLSVASHGKLRLERLIILIAFVTLTF